MLTMATMLLLHKNLSLFIKCFPPFSSFVCMFVFWKNLYPKASTIPSIFINQHLKRVWWMLLFLHCNLFCSLSLSLFLLVCFYWSVCYFHGVCMRKFSFHSFGHVYILFFFSSVCCFVVVIKTCVYFLLWHQNSFWITTNKQITYSGMQILKTQTISKLFEITTPLNI